MKISEQLGLTFASRRAERVGLGRAERVEEVTGLDRAEHIQPQTTSGIHLLGHQLANDLSIPTVAHEFAEQVERFRVFCSDVDRN